MKKPSIPFGMFISFLALSACGGGGSSSLDAFAAEYAALGADPTLASMTPNATVDALNGAANYSGVINIGTDDPANPAGTASYYGNLDMAVNFNSSTTTDAISGTAGNFVQFFSTIASPKTGSSVSGSLALSGNLTGTNESFTDGLAGTATGTIDGISVSYTLDGNINGLTGNGVSLYFSGANAVSTGGVGLAVQ